LRRCFAPVNDPLSRARSWWPALTRILCATLLRLVSKLVDRPRSATWCAAALALAMLTTAFSKGVGALADRVALIAVIWSLARLRNRAPTARSTSDLVGVVLGDRASTMVALPQTCAYLFLATNAAAATGLVAARVSPWMGDPLDGADAWWPLMSAVAVLASAAALIGLSLAIAVLAEVFGGAAPMPVGPAAHRPCGDQYWSTGRAFGRGPRGDHHDQQSAALRGPTHGSGVGRRHGVHRTDLDGRANSTTVGLFYQIGNFELVVDGCIPGPRARTGS